MIMLVFGFHRPPDFVNAEMALWPARGSAPAIRRGVPGAAKGVFVIATRSVREAINVVFTRIVNDYSTVHGTTAVCPMRGESYEPVNLGS
jgi:hypothetical protein